MKIYDKKALFMTILYLTLIGLELWMIRKGNISMLDILILLYVFSRLKINIKAVFSKEGSLQRKKLVEKEKKAYKNAFGRIAPLVPFSFLFLIGLGILLLKLVKGSLFGFYVIIFGVFSPILVDAIITSEMHRMETEQDMEETEENYESVE